VGSAVNPEGRNEGWIADLGHADSTPPEMVPQVTGTLGNNDWYRSNVILNWKVTDSDSGITSTNGCSPQTLTNDTPGTAFTCFATNGAGTTGSNSITLKIDQSAPQINVISPAASSYIVNANLTAAYACTDPVSGTTSCKGSVPSGAVFSTSPVNSHTFLVNATDGAGNTSTKAVTYKIEYDWRGFLKPAKNFPSTNVVKAGVTIPIKWQLLDANGQFITDLTSLAGTSHTPQPCQSSSVNTIEQTSAASGPVFRYDKTANQFVYHWQTKKSWVGTCRLFQVTLRDGNIKWARFQFR
jgi:hypothetical protein